MGFGRSFDPRTKEGVFNWASVFVPGPGRGGRFVGRDTQAQEAFLRQLGGDVPSHNVELPWGGESVRLPNPIWESRSPNAHIPGTDIHSDPGVHEIAKRLGYTSGDPVTELLNTVLRQPSRMEIAQEAEWGAASQSSQGTRAKLGRSQDRLPDWAATEKQQRAAWRAKWPGRGYDEEAAKRLIQEQQQRKVDELARIVATMKRRRFG